MFVDHRNHIGLHAFIAGLLYLLLPPQLAWSAGGAGTNPQPAAAAPNDVQLCNDPVADPDDRIPACTRLLDHPDAGRLIAEVYNHRGAAKVRKGYLDDAIADFTSALNQNPKFKDALKNRGIAYQMQGNYDEAFADFNRALRLDPRSPDLYNARGSALFNQEQFGPAIADFDRVISLDPKFVKAYVNRGLAFHFTRRLDRAIADFDMVIRLAPNEPLGYLNRAAALVDKGSLKAAIADYDQAIRLDPQNPVPYTGRGEAWRLQGNLEKALTDHNRAIELNPDDQEAYNNRALAFKDQGKLDEAIADCDKAILLNSKFFLAWANRGMLKRLRGDFLGSLTDLDEATKLNPRSPIPLTFRGETRLESGDVDRALKDFNDALLILPDFVAAYTGRGLTYEKRSDWAKASADFEKALSLSANLDAGLARPAQKVAREHLVALALDDATRAADKGDFRSAIAAIDKAIPLDPNNSRLYTRRGEAWRLQGDLEKALADQSKAIGLNPNEEAYNDRALAFRDQGKLEKALADCDEAIRLNSTYDKAYTTRGLLRRLKADLPGSLADLNQAVKLNPNSPVALFFRGETLRDSDNNDGAMKDFNDALLISPEFAAVYTGRGLTYEKQGDEARAKEDYKKALSLPPYVDAGLTIPAQKLAKERLAEIEKREQLASLVRPAPPPPRPEPPKIPEEIRQALDHRGHALLIGVSDYDPTTGWPKLPNVKRDLHELQQGLAPYFETVETVSDPTVAELRDRMSDFLLGQWNKPGERLFVYYAGHGFTAFNETSEDDDGYITGKNTPVKAITKAVSFFEVDSWSRQTRARHVLMVFDSCFSGSLFKTMGPTTQEPPPNDFGSVQVLLRRPMRYYITAGRQNEEVSADSTFAKLLLRGLSGEADTYKEGIISAEELGVYLSHRVPEFSPRPQTPQFKSIGVATLSEGQFYFLTGKTTVVPRSAE